jgi:hypothetical protein
MPFKDPDPTDPNMLVGVVLPADPEATRDMAYLFAEEFARMGYTREQLLWLFKNPFYGGAHGAYQALGETEILAIIDECVKVWGRIRVTFKTFKQFNRSNFPWSSPATRGRKGIRGSNDWNPRNGLNGSQRLNRLNGLNARREERNNE